MLKICLLLALAATASAKSKIFYVNSADFIEINKPAVTSKSVSKTETSFTWNQGVNEQINALRAITDSRFTKTGKKDSFELENLCQETKKDTKMGNVQKFILSVIAGVDKCPIKKNSKTTFTVPYSFSYTSDSTMCGPISMNMKLLKLSDKGDAHPIISGTLKGNITGC